MNLNQLAKEICAREGLKKQVNIAQMKEILRVIVDMEFSHMVWTEKYGFSVALDAPSKIIAKETVRQFRVKSNHTLREYEKATGIKVKWKNK